MERMKRSARMRLLEAKIIGAVKLAATADTHTAYFNYLDDAIDATKELLAVKETGIVVKPGGMVIAAGKTEPGKS